MTRDHVDMSEIKKETSLGNRINFAQLMTMLVQAAVLVWGASALNTTVNNQQKQIEQLNAQFSTLATAQQNSQNSLDSRVSKIEGIMTYQTKVLDNINDAVMRRQK